jgi:FkbM family methyltransferase
MRSVARRLGLTKIVQQLIPRSNYEAKFHRAVLVSVQTGDVIWDIGANVGFYAKIFCEFVGPTGKVIAFEPTPKTCAVLCDGLKGFPWAHVEQTALSDYEGTAAFIVGDADRRNHIEKTAGESDRHDSITVPVVRADSYWKASGLTPNVIKIDVEGFEGEVLDGMGDLLMAPDLRVVLVEVHFKALEERGLPKHPLYIESLLRRTGFKPTWVDASHLVAERG